MYVKMKRKKICVFHTKQELNNFFKFPGCFESWVKMKTGACCSGGLAISKSHAMTFGFHLHVGVRYCTPNDETAHK